MSNTYNILVVDDSATTRAIIKRTLKMTDVPIGEIFEAADGSAALSLIAAQPSNSVHLVLADLNMPNMDGFEMTRRLLADPQTAAIPVAVVTANPNLQQIKTLQAGGVKGYLRKPFTPEGLRDLVTRLIETPNAGATTHA